MQALLLVRQALPDLSYHILSIIAQFVDKEKPPPSDGSHIAYQLPDSFFFTARTISAAHSSSAGASSRSTSGRLTGSSVNRKGMMASPSTRVMPQAISSAMLVLLGAKGGLLQLPEDTQRLHFGADEACTQNQIPQAQHKGVAVKGRRGLGKLVGVLHQVDEH